MAFALIELHETRPNEHIPDSDHAIVRQEMAAVGMSHTCSVNGVERTLPRGSYFGEGVSLKALTEAHGKITCRLNREFSLAAAPTGDTTVWGLKPVETLLTGSRPYIAPPSISSKGLLTNLIYGSTQLNFPKTSLLGSIGNETPKKLTSLVAYGNAYRGQ